MAMVAIGQAAVEKHRGIEIARREIARLAVELNVQCSANSIVDDEVLVLIKEGTPQSHLGLTRVGERRPLIPPVGLCHVAWGGEAAIQAYIDKASGHLSDQVRSRLVSAFPVIRQRGYAIAMNGAGNGQDRARRPCDRSIRCAAQAYWSSVFDLVRPTVAQRSATAEPRRRRGGRHQLHCGPGVFAAGTVVAFNSCSAACRAN